MNDATESIRRERVAEINLESDSREALEATYGQVWRIDEMSAEFQPIGFMAPLIVVSRRLGDQSQFVAAIALECHF